MPQHSQVDTTFYVHIEPDFFDGSSELEVRSARATHITRSRASKPRSGCVVVKLTVRLPSSAFLPLRPEAVVVVSADYADVVEVEARDAHEETL